MQAAPPAAQGCAQVAEGPRGQRESGRGGVCAHCPGSMDSFTDGGLVVSSGYFSLPCRLRGPARGPAWPVGTDRSLCPHVAEGAGSSRRVP